MKSCCFFIILSFVVANKLQGGNFLQGKDSLRFNSIMAGTDYSSNTSTFGRFSTIARQPSFTGSLGFYSKSGWNVSVTSMALGNSDSTATAYSMEHDLALGYDFKPFRNITLTGSYTRMFHSKNSYSLKSLHNHEFSAGIIFNKGVVMAGINGYYFMGDYNEWMNSAYAGLNFVFNNFHRNHSISFSPEISGIWGNQQYYNQYAYKTYWYLYGVAERYPSMTIGELYDQQRNFPRLWRLINRYPRILNSFRSLDHELVISDLFRVSNKYNLTSLNCSLPVNYNLGNFTFNITYSVTFPMNLPPYLDFPVTSYISAGIFYAIIL